MRRLTSTVAALLAACVFTRGADADVSRVRDRVFYLPVNMLVDANVAEAQKLIARAAKAGYNAVLLTDSKFMRWDLLPEKYAQNVRKVRESCREAGVACIAALFPIGYSNDLLSRDPDLAEGLPVIDAPFVVKGGALVPLDDGPALANGGFEAFRKEHQPDGWSFVDAPGAISFKDTEVFCEGRASLRMQDIGVRGSHGNGRACQALAVKPFRYYHVSVAVKTKDFKGASQTRIAVLAADGASLSHTDTPIAPTQDWKRIDIVFNSLAYDKVNLYFGTWGGKGGTIWWDDARLEPAGFVNTVRRAGAPLKVTNADGSIVYEEGADFAPIKDPRLGVDPYTGEYTVWHAQPSIAIPTTSRLREGDKVLASYYHMAIVYHGQVMCCMAEPKLYELLAWQFAQVKEHVVPDGYAMQHDEIRVQGWDHSCATCGKTPAQLLAHNVRECVRIIREGDPGRTIYVWSDMFDPAHNAKDSGSYYLVKGNGPWHGSWEGLSPEVILLNWNSDPATRAASLAHFAGRGHRQILAGYYDGPVEAITGWLDDACKVTGVTGVMYTTWQRDYDNLEAFLRTAIFAADRK